MGTKGEKERDRDVYGVRRRKKKKIKGSKKERRKRKGRSLNEHFRVRMVGINWEGAQEALRGRRRKRKKKGGGKPAYASLKKITKEREWRGRGRKRSGR